LYNGLAYLDNNVFCNKRHPEDGIMGPKLVGKKVKKRFPTTGPWGSWRLRLQNF
jgi:hypothetical protein